MAAKAADVKTRAGKGKGTASTDKVLVDEFNALSIQGEGGAATAASKESAAFAYLSGLEGSQVQHGSFSAYNKIVSAFYADVLKTMQEPAQQGDVMADTCNLGGSTTTAHWRAFCGSSSGGGGALETLHKEKREELLELLHEHKWMMSDKELLDNLLGDNPARVCILNWEAVDYKARDGFIMPLVKAFGRDALTTADTVVAELKKKLKLAPSMILAAGLHHVIEADGGIPCVRLDVFLHAAKPEMPPKYKRTKAYKALAKEPDVPEETKLAAVRSLANLVLRCGFDLVITTGDEAMKRFKEALPDRWQQDTVPGEDTKWCSTLGLREHNHKYKPHGEVAFKYNSKRRVAAVVMVAHPSRVVLTSEEEVAEACLTEYDRVARYVRKAMGKKAPRISVTDLYKAYDKVRSQWC